MIVIPVYINGITSLKDRSWKITVGTQELAPDNVASIASMQGKFGVMAFKESEFQHSEETMLDEIDTDLAGGKSPSQRLRNTLHVLFKQDSKGFKDFKAYYASEMEKVINHFKTKITD